MKPSWKDIALARESAHAELMKAVASAEENEPHSVPCLGEDSYNWTASHIRLLERAATRCRECPLIEQCRQYGQQHEPGTSSVWGGMVPRQKNIQTELLLEGVT